jgi:hypothetical protein
MFQSDRNETKRSFDVLGSRLMSPGEQDIMPRESHEGDKQETWVKALQIERYSGYIYAL